MTAPAPASAPALKAAAAPARKKLRVATTSLAGCFGCHMSLLDLDERLLALLEQIEFDRSPLTDLKTCGPCDLGIIEGGLCNAENVHVLREGRGAHGWPPLGAGWATAVSLIGAAS